MTRYEILNTQLDKAAETIREARRRKVAKVLIIHGKGSGRLQTEVHDLLSKLGNLEFYFADFTDGGYGATEVRLFNGGV
jgi:dsDNA-specific endonuclease/ATPase MutS2